MAIGDVWRVFTSVEGLLTFEAKQKELLADLEDRLSSLEHRVTRLESREELVATEARSAARVGAADAMQGVILQIGERLGALERRQPQLPRKTPRKTPPNTPDPT